jgi:hypothetical protein
MSNDYYNHTSYPTPNSTLTSAAMRQELSAIGAGFDKLPDLADQGTVQSVQGTGTVNGITLTGTVTKTGQLVLGGTLSGVSLTTQVSGVLPIANGGTNANSASAARTSLGLAIGSNVQAYSVVLQGLSGVTTAADQVIYSTGSNTFAMSGFTAYGRSLAALADAAAGRTALGLGSVATYNIGTSGNAVGLLDTANTWSQPQTTTGLRAVTVPIAATTIDWAAGEAFTRSVNTNIVFSFSNIPAPGVTAAIMVRLTVAGDRTIGWPAAVRWRYGVTPPLNPDSTHLFAFFTDNGGATIFGTYLTNYPS